MSSNFIVFIEQPLFLDEDRVKIGCVSDSSTDKIPLEYPHRQNYSWKRGEMVSLQIDSMVYPDIEFSNFTMRIFFDATS